MNKITVNDMKSISFPQGDYVSPGLETVQPDLCFPNMVLGNKYDSSWLYLRRDIPHNWYVDQRRSDVGFVSRDEAHILYNTALKFQGKKALEIGCWMGWSACHLALGGVELDVIDPMLSEQLFYESVTDSLKQAGVKESVNLIPGYSPQTVAETANKLQRKWSLIFIDGHHEAPAPLDDAIICEQFAEADALILFHDLTAPDVGKGLDYLKAKGWQTMVYQTMQIMGVAWRGNVEPVMHQPDNTINWRLPPHLQSYNVSGVAQTKTTDKFSILLQIIQPYTLLSETKLFSLYSQAQQIYDYLFWLPKILKQTLSRRKIFPS
ncbi:class I SAM-dependent methyltransferase [Nostoc sp. FACHB-87]|uniref:class I SAM-dependent methyltransferase n=1 Tax=Nostocaceae TaxID=1162 RepID=UPI001689C033|nr:MULTISPECIES: class I SAM-dependent methyltransferase [Nostocaceae]MBD2455808.1 class I SAM-dependent methyltransferase [Nostoc sp. FACHB-87]MBD2477151.1 class I SAM-dependent methyltransferase [Anabaena sp. FACHB-83]